MLDPTKLKPGTILRPADPHLWSMRYKLGNRYPNGWEAVCLTLENTEDAFRDSMVPDDSFSQLRRLNYQFGMTLTLANFSQWPVSIPVGFLGKEDDVEPLQFRRSDTITLTKIGIGDPEKFSRDHRKDPFYNEWIWLADSAYGQIYLAEQELGHYFRCPDPAWGNQTCPCCGSAGAYLGFLQVECVNFECQHYRAA